jgi:hypothetical protein
MDKTTRQLTKQKQHIQHFYERREKKQSLTGHVRTFIDVNRHIQEIHSMLSDDMTQEQKDIMLEATRMAEELMSIIEPIYMQHTVVFSDTYDKLIESDLTYSKKSV